MTSEWQSLRIIRCGPAKAQELVTSVKKKTLKSLLPHCDKSSEVKLHNNDDDDRNYTFLMQKSFANDLRNSTEMQNKRQIHTELLLLPLPLKATLTILQLTSL